MHSKELIYRIVKFSEFEVEEFGDFEFIFEMLYLYLLKIFSNLRFYIFLIKKCWII